MLMKAAHHGARLLALATGGLLCTVLLIPSISGDPSVTIASFHPFLMTLAFVILMSLGVTSYVSDFGGKLNRVFPNRASRRLLHGSLLFSATVLALLGYLIRFNSTQRTPGGTHLPQSSDPLWIWIHVPLGYATLGLMVFMVFIGFYKFVVRTRENVAVMKWHGHLGLVVWAASLLTVSAACYGYFYGSNTWVAVAGWVGMGALLILSVVTIFFDPDRSAAQLENAWGDSGPGSGYGKFEDETMMGSLFESPTRGSMN